MNNCIFCKIVKGEKKEDFLYEDEDIVVFADNNPRAKTHLLITLKAHYFDFSEMMEKEPTLLQKIGEVVEKVIKTSSIKGKEYTWGFHCGGKQSVNHVHAQLLAGMKEDELVL